VDYKGRDASGNIRFPDVGNILKEQLQKYTRDKGMSVEVRYVDLRYMVRSVKSNSHDTELCS
jgi:6-phosphofructokinase 1